MTSCHVDNDALPPSFFPPRSAFFFPPVENMGQVAVQVQGLTHGYNGRTLFKDADLTIERGERVAIIGPNGGLVVGRLGWLCTCHVCPAKKPSTQTCLANNDVLVGWRFSTHALKQPHHRLVQMCCVLRVWPPSHSAAW